MNLIDDLPENIKDVIHRLKFIDKLFYNRSKFQGEFNYNIEYKFHPYFHYIATINYLLLTCFDAMLESKFIDFGGWLRMKDNRYRDEVLSNNESNKITPIEMTTLLYEKYKEMYGVNQTIRTLVFERFSEVNRTKLFNSFEVYKITKIKERPKNVLSGDYDKSELIELPEKKFKIFLNIRNKFTHEAFIHAGLDDAGYTNCFSLSEGKIQKRISNWTKIDVKSKTHKTVTLIGWPYILREIIGDHIFSTYNFDVRIKKLKIKEYLGQYNFELLWSQSEKILWAKTEDGILIYMGGSTFSKPKEAINYIDEVVNDAINMDKILSMSNTDIVSIPYSRLMKYGSLVNVIGDVISNKGNNYPIRYNPEMNSFMFYDENTQNWWKQPATTIEISDIIEEARSYINEVFEK